MTSNEPQGTEPLAVTSDVPSKALPFEYEDRTDGRHQRMVEEIKAARTWTQRRRALGLRPN